MVYAFDHLRRTLFRTDKWGKSEHFILYANIHPTHAETRTNTSKFYPGRGGGYTLFYVPSSIPHKLQLRRIHLKSTSRQECEGRLNHDKNRKKKTRRYVSSASSSCRIAWLLSTNWPTWREGRVNHSTHSYSSRGWNLFDPIYMRVFPTAKPIGGSYCLSHSWNKAIISTTGKMTLSRDARSPDETSSRSEGHQCGRQNQEAGEVSCGILPELVPSSAAYRGETRSNGGRRGLPIHYQNTCKRKNQCTATYLRKPDLAPTKINS